VMSMLLATTYYRFGGWRKARLGVANRRAAPLPSV
jgi:hypothetical protein